MAKRSAKPARTYRVGLMVGREWSFPPALIEEVAEDLIDPQRKRKVRGVEASSRIKKTLFDNQESSGIFEIRLE